MKNLHDHRYEVSAFQNTASPLKKAVNCYASGGYENIKSVENINQISFVCVFIGNQEDTYIYTN